jgi:hypothetical protein
MINRDDPFFKAARKFVIDAYETGTTIHIDWSFPQGAYVGKEKYEKAVRRALRWAQRQTRVEFKAWANGEVASQGFHGHLQVVSLVKLNDGQVEELIEALRSAWFFMLNGKRSVSDKRRRKLEQECWDCNVVRDEAQYLRDYQSKDNIGYDDHDVLTARWAYVLDHELRLDGFPVVLGGRRRRDERSYFECKTEQRIS